MLVNMNIGEFLEETASSSPAPGGGSVSALAGALGGALASMVGNLSLGKNLDSEEESWIKEKISKAQEMMTGLKEGIDKDTDAFNEVMKAFKMPKTTEEEKKVRSTAIQEAMKGAANFPYETAQVCLSVMELALEMLEKGNPNAASDAAVAGLMGYAGLNGALYNVKINLGSIKDVGYIDEMKKKIEEIQIASEGLFSKLKVLSEKKIG